MTRQRLPFSGCTPDADVNDFADALRPARLATAANSALGSTGLLRCI